MNTLAVLDLGDSILYLAALLADRPRRIDRYIDYFGDGHRAARVEEVQGPRRAAA
jgi:hypothetical protein